MPPDSFYARLLEIIQDQNAVLTEIKTGQALSNEIQQRLLDTTKEQGAVIRSVQEELNAHKKDAVTWSKLGGGFLFVGKAVGLVGTGFAVILAAINVFTRLGWF